MIRAPSLSCDRTVASSEPLDTLLILSIPHTNGIPIFRIGKARSIWIGWGVEGEAGSAKVSGRVALRATRGFRHAYWRRQLAQVSSLGRSSVVAVLKDCVDDAARFYAPSIAPDNASSNVRYPRNTQARRAAPRMAAQSPPVRGSPTSSGPMRLQT